MFELDVKQKVDQIAECVFEKIQKAEAEYYGLYSGEFGQFLFLFYYSKYSKNENYISLTEKYAERLLHQFVGGEK